MTMAAHEGPKHVPLGQTETKKLSTVSHKTVTFCSGGDRIESCSEPLPLPLSPLAHCLLPRARQHPTWSATTVPVWKPNCRLGMEPCGLAMECAGRMPCWKYGSRQQMVIGLWFRPIQTGHRASSLWASTGKKPVIRATLREAQFTIVRSERARIRLRTQASRSNKAGRSIVSSLDMTSAEFQYRSANHANRSSATRPGSSHSRKCPPTSISVQRWTL